MELMISKFVIFNEDSLKKTNKNVIFMLMN